MGLSSASGTGPSGLPMSSVTVSGLDERTSLGTPRVTLWVCSVGATRTDELAVMLDCFQPLTPTAAALGVEDPGYQDSFL